jgi:hypothetical protein
MKHLRRRKTTSAAGGTDNQPTTNMPSRATGSTTPKEQGQWENS